MAVTNRFTYGLYLSLVLLESISVTISGQNQRPLLRDLLEKALVGNSTNLFELQKVYFHPAGKRPGIIHLLANVTVGNISNTTLINDCPAFKCNHESSWCHSNPFNFTLSPYSIEDNSTLQIPDLLGFEGRGVLRLLDPSFFQLTGVLGVPQLWFENLYNSESDSEDHNEIRLDLYISELESMPEYRELCDALSMVLVWVRMIRSICTTMILLAAALNSTNDQEYYTLDHTMQPSHDYKRSAL